jgi:hypothetical protein
MAHSNKAEEFEMSEKGIEFKPTVRVGEKLSRRKR